MKEKDLVNKSKRKRNVLVIYDVSDTKRRNRLVKCLEQYTVRVQKSAFQGCLTMEQCKTLCRQMRRFIDMQTDSLRVYTDTVHMKIQAWGKQADMGEDVLIF